MAKNLKALTEEELDYMKDKYSFKLFEDYIVVSCKGYNRTTLHDIHSPFEIRSPIRKIKISTQAIDLWIKKYQNLCSLVEVQNAISTLIVTYQEVNDENIDTCIKRTTSKIKEI